jgi:hypothetical protein
MNDLLRDVLACLHVEEYGKPGPLGAMERELVAATLVAVRAAGYWIERKP